MKRKRRQKFMALLIQTTEGCMVKSPTSLYLVTEDRAAVLYGALVRKGVWCDEHMRTEQPSYAWEIRTYWQAGRKGEGMSAYDSFPDAGWEENEVGIMHQLIAIHQGVTDRPEERFYIEEVVVERS